MVDMRIYDPAQPLIFIHVPKSGGTSTRDVVERWFGSNGHRHYSDPHAVNGQILPQRHDLSHLMAEGPSVIYGHFNKLRGFGVEDYYPDVTQFLTILREPCELAISRYFFVRNSPFADRPTSPVFNRTLEQYLLAEPGITLNFFPRPVTRDNYRDLIDEFFIDIGLTEHLAESLARIAVKIGKPFDARDLQHTNATARDEPVSADIMDRFRELNRLECDVYDHVAKRFLAQPNVLPDISPAAPVP